MPETSGFRARYVRDSQAACADALVDKWIDIRDDLRQAMRCVQTMSKSAQDKIRVVSPAVLPHVDELITLSACLTCLIAVVLRGSIRITGLRVPEDPVIFNGQMQVGDDNIQFFSRWENATVILHDCVVGDELADQTSQISLCLVSVLGVAQRTS